jgi:hypothetical protein
MRSGVVRSDPSGNLTDAIENTAGLIVYVPVRGAVIGEGDTIGGVEGFCR